MSIEMIALLSVVSVVVICAGILLAILLPKRLNKKKYVLRWRELQGYCKDKDCWKDAIESADKLLDKALRQRKFKGGSPGERLVSAQRHLSDNDGIWFAHNLYKKLIAEPNKRLREDDVKRALTAFRQALRDLGALPNGEPSAKK